MKNKHKNLMNINSWSSLTTFNQMIIDGDLSTKGAIDKWFKELVDNKDYNRAIHDDVLEYSYSLL